MYRDKLMEAEQHILNAEYDAARNILSSLNHPVATRWLKELDQIAPHKQDMFFVMFVTICWLITFGAILLAFAMITSDMIRVIHLNNVGVSTSGQVVNAYTNNGDTDSTTYHLVYRFSADGLVYFQNADDIPQEIYNAQPLGSNINILYDPVQPHISMIPDTQNVLKIVVLLPLLLLISGFVLQPLWTFLKKTGIRKRKNIYSLTQLLW